MSERWGVRPLRDSPPHGRRNCDVTHTRVDAAFLHTDT